jgi:hypothetical protein
MDYKLLQLLHELQAVELPPLRRPFFSDDSPFNADVRAAAVHPESAAYIAFWASVDPDPLTCSSEEYTYPVYEVDGGPLVPIAVTGNVSRLDSEGLAWRSYWGKGEFAAPVTPAMLPSFSSHAGDPDHSIVIVDHARGLVYDMWRYDPDARTSASAASYPIGHAPHAQWDGVPKIVHPENNLNRWLTRGSGLPFAAGLVRCWEIEAQLIPHALAVALRRAACGAGHQWPAGKSDGESFSRYAIPLGMWLRLRGDFPLAGLTPVQRTLAVALHTHGLFAADRSGRSKLIVEGQESWTPEFKQKYLGELAPTAASIFRPRDFEVIVHPAGSS